MIPPRLAGSEITDNRVIRTIEMFNTGNMVNHFLPMVETWDSALRTDQTKVAHHTWDFPEIRKFLQGLTPKSRRRVAYRMLQDACRPATEIGASILAAYDDPDSERFDAYMTMGAAAVAPVLEQAAGLKCWLFNNYKYLRKHYVIIRPKVNREQPATPPG